MDVPHVLTDIEIRQGLKGYNRKSSPISHNADVVGLSVYIFLLYGSLLAIPLS